MTVGAVFVCRQLYVRKCKELNDEKDISEDVFYENLEQAKSTIRVIFFL